MKGFYVYCIRQGTGEKNIKTPNSRARITTGQAQGIEFGGKISAIPFKDIEVVVSDVDLSKFNEKKIEDKLREDIKWAERNVQRHHSIVAEAYKTEMVIPMKFGTIFKTRKSLEAMLAKHYKKFKRLLAQLVGKQEWGVKIHLEHEKFIEFLKKKNEKVKELEQKKSTMSEGGQWYADKKIEESVAAQFEEEVENQLQAVVKRLEGCCEQIVFCNLLPREAMEAGKDNVFNAACLIDNSKLDHFKKVLQETRKEYDPIGATLVTTGPWPPYNFVQLNEKK